MSKIDITNSDNIKCCKFLYKNNEYFNIQFNQIDCVDNTIFDILIDKISFVFSNFNENNKKYLIYILIELLKNSFRSKIEYFFRENKDLHCHFDKVKGNFVCNNCNKCVDVKLIIEKVDNLFSFKISNYSKLSEQSKEKIEKILKSNDISEFPNLVQENYSSYTGVSGMGIFSSNNFLMKEFNSKLNFSYKDDEILFSFDIDEKYLI